MSETIDNPLGLVPDFFDRYFAFFRPGHQDGIENCQLGFTTLQLIRQL